MYNRNLFVLLYLLSLYVACLTHGVLDSRSSDHPNVIEGYGTIGLEILDQTENLDAVLVPVGGGALITGIVTVIKQLKPGIRVYVSYIIYFYKYRR